MERQRKPVGDVAGTPDEQSPSLVYVSCGARAESRNSLVEATPGAIYVGFEPDPDECAGLRRKAAPRYHYFPTAVGKRSETRTLYVTNNPSCSSLLAPNAAFFGRFKDCAREIDVTGNMEVQTVALDAYLPTVGICRVDFLKLDTQGTELEILQGAKVFLASTVLGVDVEVEFSPIYQNQALFSEVDAYLRQFGFMLFDLSRARYRRQGYPYTNETRGQLLCGDASYLKDYQRLADAGMKAAAMKLARIAAFYGFHDYALEITEFLLEGGAGLLTPAEADELTHVRHGYLSSLASSRLVRAMSMLKQSPLSRLLHKVGAASKRVSAAYTSLIRQGSYAWID